MPPPTAAAPPAPPPLNPPEPPGRGAAAPARPPPPRHRFRFRRAAPPRCRAWGHQFEPGAAAGHGERDGQKRPSKVECFHGHLFAPTVAAPGSAARSIVSENATPAKTAFSRLPLRPTACGHAHSGEDGNRCQAFEHPAPLRRANSRQGASRGFARRTAKRRRKRAAVHRAARRRELTRPRRSMTSVVGTRRLPRKSAKRKSSSTS